MNARSRAPLQGQAEAADEHQRQQRGQEDRATSPLLSQIRQHLLAVAALPRQILVHDHDRSIHAGQTVTELFRVGLAEHLELREMTLQHEIGR